MDTYEKIRLMRELNQLSQEEMAEKMNMSLSGYSKFERGETRLHLDKLKQVANIFNIDVRELVYPDDNKVSLIIMNEGNDCKQANYYGDNNLIIENEKLRSELDCKEQILHSKLEIIEAKNNVIEQLTKENERLQEIISLLKEK